MGSSAKDKEKGDPEPASSDSLNSAKNANNAANPQDGSKKPDQEPDPAEGALFTQIACGGHHTALVHDGILLTWGGGAFGKLGHGHREAEMQPRVVTALLSAKKKVATVALGAHHSACVTTRGEVYTWY